jgi:hypothetical protein
MKLGPALLAGIVVLVGAIGCCCRAAAVADQKGDDKGAGVAPLLRNEADSEEEQRQPFVPKKRGHFD